MHLSYFSGMVKHMLHIASDAILNGLATSLASLPACWSCDSFRSFDWPGERLSGVCKAIVKFKTQLCPLFSHI